MVPATLDEQRIGLAELGDDLLAHLVEEGALEADVGAVADRAAHDATQDVGAAGLVGEHAVGDQEGGGAGVVGDDAEGALTGAEIGGWRAGEALGEVDQRGEQRGAVVAADALHHGGEALEAGAGVDAGLGQVDEAAVGELLVLHEHEVPQLGVAGVLVGGAELAVALGVAGGPLAVEDVDLRAGAAGAGVAHRPEVLLGGQAVDAVLGDELGPQRVGLVVGGGRLALAAEHRHDELLGGDAEVLREELPAPAHRVLLEVVAEREVAEHLEQGVVTVGEADVVEVVVFAAGAHAALDADGALVGARVATEEGVLELDHARVGEQQGRVVGGHQRRGRHDGVAARGEEVEEAAADLVGAGGPGLHGAVRIVDLTGAPRDRSGGAGSAEASPLTATLQRTRQSSCSSLIFR
jgi:hypothetical protein